MLVAHIPAGYIATKYFLRKYPGQLAGGDKNGERGGKPARHRCYLFLGLLFSIIPDLDLLYFYCVDSSVHHHKYFPHLPVFWILSLSILALISAFFKVKRMGPVILLMSINILIHLLLDTLAGSIWWLYPWLDKPFHLIDIPARFHHWIVNFISHWTFLVEVAICVIALCLFLANYREGALKKNLSR